MKTTTAPKLSASLFRPESGAHTVRVIKAGQAAPFAAPDPDVSAAGTAAPAHPNAEVRMVGSGPDYCDIELVCGCGKVTSFRCWNTEEKAAVK